MRIFLFVAYCLWLLRSIDRSIAERDDTHSIFGSSRNALEKLKMAVKRMTERNFFK